MVNRPIQSEETLRVISYRHGRASQDGALSHPVGICQKSLLPVISLLRRQAERVRVKFVGLCIREEATLNPALVGEAQGITGRNHDQVCI